MRHILWGLLLCWAACGQPAAPEPLLRDGDLLFQDLDCGPFCEAIEAVTEGALGYDFSHVGLVQVLGQDTFVLEAGGQGVRRSPLDSFLLRSLDAGGRPKVLLARLDEARQALIPEALRRAEARLGRPYDEWFDINNDAYYCSELIYWAFKEANAGEPLFPLYPMTFKDPATGDFFPLWTDYFAALGVPIPEAAPGLNPGGMSRDSALHLVYDFRQSRHF